MRFQLIHTFAIVVSLLLFGCNRTVAIPAQVQEPAAPRNSTAGQKSSQEPTTQHTNRLAQETSPYLLQHARNPVNWYPWGSEAFELALKENKPIFLSIGYSTCYWCHVMERESFENEDVAAILNEHFICIKVDREERPEVDQQYMTATQLITGRGGWPNSVWLTPDGKPWMAGTYFPREKFKSSLLKLDELWKTRHADVLEQAETLTSAVERYGAADYNAKPISQELFSTTIESLQTNFDRQLGGFGSAPKFPPHANLAVLADQYRRHKAPDVLEMIDRTLTGMARGGVYDQIGGGFHRYSTDAKWLVPHFEKMLYDNAQLVRSYTDGFMLTGNREHRDAVEGIFVWLQREMTSPDGAFYSALDSESDAQEGKFYVWSWNEILEVLGDEDGKLFADVYGARESGNFKDEVAGHESKFNIFHRSKSITEIAANKKIEPVEFADRLAEMRAKLLDRRKTRVYPHLDDKILAAWNGLMIDGLAYSGRHLKEPRYIAAAERAANFIELSMIRDGRLLRSWRAGQAKLDGYLDDYAYVAAGFLELYRATGKEQYLESAKRLADRLLAEFQDDSAGGFFFTTENPERVQQDVLIRSKNLSGGGNQPSGNGVAAQLLFELGSLTGDKRYTDSANRTMDGLSGYMWQVSILGDHLLIAAATKLEHAASAEAIASAKPTDADATFAATAIKGELYASKLQVFPGESFQIAVRMTIEPGWHLYGEGSDANVARPVSLTFDSNNLALLVETRAPAGIRKQDAVLGQELEILEGVITYFVQLQIPDTARPGKHQLKLAVLTQACDAKQCAAPEQNEIVLNYEVSSKPVSSETRHLDIFDRK